MPAEHLSFREIAEVYRQLVGVRKAPLGIQSDKPVLNALQDASQFLLALPGFVQGQFQPPALVLEKGLLALIFGRELLLPGDVVPHHNGPRQLAPHVERVSPGDSHPLLTFCIAEAEALVVHAFSLQHPAAGQFFQIDRSSLECTDRERPGRLVLPWKGKAVILYGAAVGMNNLSIPVVHHDRFDHGVENGAQLGGATVRQIRHCGQLSFELPLVRDIRGYRYRPGDAALFVQDRRGTVQDRAHAAVKTPDINHLPGGGLAALQRAGQSPILRLQFSACVRPPALIYPVAGDLLRQRGIPTPDHIHRPVLGNYLPIRSGNPDRHRQGVKHHLKAFVSAPQLQLGAHLHGNIPPERDGANQFFLHQDGRGGGLHVVLLPLPVPETDQHIVGALASQRPAAGKVLQRQRAVARMPIVHGAQVCLQGLACWIKSQDLPGALVSPNRDPLPVVNQKRIGECVNDRLQFRRPVGGLERQFIAQPSQVAFLRGRISPEGSGFSNMDQEAFHPIRVPVNGPGGHQRQPGLFARSRQGQFQVSRAGA